MAVGEVLSTSFSADSKLLATGLANDTVALWDVDSEDDVLKVLPGRTAAFAPDGCTLAFGGSGEAITLISL